MRNTKFMLAVGVSVAIFALAALYILKVDKPDATVLGAMLGVVTLVVGGYFTSNVVASGQAVSSTTTTDTPGKTVTVDKPKDGEV